MKKMITRIAACSLAVLIAFNAVLVPRSKAVGAEVVGTAAFATSTLAAYMTATGVPLTVISGGAAAASAGTASLVSGYAAATGATYEVVTTAIAAGTTISGGAIILGAAAVAVLAGIVAWAINEYSLDSHSDPVVFYEETSYFLEDGSPLIFSQTYNEIGNASLFRVHYVNDYNDYKLSNGTTLRFTGSSIVNYAPSSCVLMSYSVNDLAYWCYGVSSDNYVICYILDANKAILDSAITTKTVSTAFGEIETAGEVCVGLGENYDALPEMTDDKQMIIYTGISDTLPELMPDAIFESIAGNEFAPTYTEEPISAPEPNPDDESVTNPDTGEEIGLLRRIAIAVEAWANKIGVHGGFLERIANACEALAEKIAEAIRNIFVPDAALTTQITDAFAAKFSFVPTLHRLGTDLLSIGPDSKPPVVYIHLEDAEGTLDYGGTVKALDMSWYQRYKEDGDRIIGGFLWLGFLWLLFKRVPAIINGGEMVQEYTAAIDRGSKRRKH